MSNMPLRGETAAYKKCRICGKQIIPAWRLCNDEMCDLRARDEYEQKKRDKKISTQSPV